MFLQLSTGYLVNLHHVACFHPALEEPDRVGWLMLTNGQKAWIKQSEYDHLKKFLYDTQQMI